MVSIRSKKQLTADITAFFGDFRDYDISDSSYNLGLGEIKCKNLLLEELEQYSDRVIKKISRLIGFYPGCQGYRPLNEKIAELIKIETGQDVKADEIILTNGAHDAITHAAFTYADVYNKILFPVPSFPYWSNTIRTLTSNEPIFCGNPDIFTHKLSDLIEKKIDKHVSMLILNNPHNPFGALLSKEQAIKINEIAKKNNVKILLDDVYRAFSKKEWIGNYFDLDNTIIVDSFSKRFGMPGLRLGFVRVPKHEVRYFRASVANHYVGINMATAVLADFILELYLNDKSLNNVPQEIAKRQIELDQSLRRLNNYGIISPKPEGGMYRVLYCNNSEKLCKELSKNNVVVKPARTSFPNNFSNIPEFIRLSVGGEHRIKEAVDKIVEVIEKLTESQLIIEEKYNIPIEEII